MGKNINPYPFLLGLILILGFFLRSEEILFNNFLFLNDQGRDMVGVKSIVADKKLTLIGPYTGMRGVFLGPLYYYFLAVPFFIFRGDPRGVMYLFTLISMASIYLGYRIGEKYFSRLTGLMIAFVLAVSPGAAAAATFIWAPHFTIPYMLFYLYFLFDWIQTKAGRSFFFLSLFVGLMFHAEIAFATPFFLANILLFAYLLKGKNLLKHYLIYGAIISAFLSPLIIFDFRHDHITVTSLMKFFSGSTQGVADKRDTYAFVLRQHFQQFIPVLKSSFISFGRISDFFAKAVAIVSVLYLIARKNRLIKALIVMPVLVYIAYMAYPYTIFQWYLMPFFALFAVLFGIYLAKLFSLNWGRPLAIIIIAILFIDAGGRLYKFYGKPDEGGTAKIKGKIAAIDTIYRDAAGKSFNLLVFAPIVFTDPYDYLVWWYGLPRYGYLPGKEKKGLVYLLIEPDPRQPWTYQGWLETVIKTGKVIDTKKLTYGFIIEKRIFDEK